jgi:AraC family transcriptional activator of pobA
MKSVKTYDHVNKNDETLSFEIARTGDIYVRMVGKPDVPHRHNYYTLIISKYARGKHIIDFKEYSLSNNTVFFVSPGQVHQIIEEKKPKGYVILFSDTFLVKNSISKSFINNLNLFREFGDSPPLELNNSTITKIWNYAQEIETIHQSDSVFKYESIGALLKLILIECNKNCDLPQIEVSETDRSSSVMYEFKSLIETNFSEWHSTSKYASELNITADYLNRLVKMQSGKTAKEHIQSRIIVEAKRLLYFSELSNKEIAFELGFTEPGNFSAFFKKCTGISPTQFVREN